MTVVQERLTEDAIYTDAERKTELSELIKEQSKLQAAAEDLEWQWMEASEALEIAE